MFCETIREDAALYFGRGFSLNKVSGFLFNPSLRCVLLIRLALMNKVFYYFFRNVLYLLHSVDVGYGAKIGKRLNLPHPLGIVVGKGVELLDDVTIYQGVTLGAKKGGYPTVEGGVVIYPNSVVVGGICIGENAVIGACVFCDKDLKTSEVYLGRTLGKNGGSL